MYLTYSLMMSVDRNIKSVMAHDRSIIFGDTVSEVVKRCQGLAISKQFESLARNDKQTLPQALALTEKVLAHHVNQHPISPQVSLYDIKAAAADLAETHRSCPNTPQAKIAEIGHAVLSRAYYAHPKTLMWDALQSCAPAGRVLEI